MNTVSLLDALETNLYIGYINIGLRIHFIMSQLRYDIYKDTS